MIWAFALKNWRIIGLAAGLLILGWWHQRAVTRAYRQGATDGEASTLQKAAMKVEMDTIEQRKALTDRKAALDVQAAQISGERAALNTARSGITAALNASLSQIAVQGVDIRNEIQAVPDDAVNSRFRNALVHARDFDRERASDR